MGTVGMMTRSDGTGYAMLEAIDKSADPFVLEFGGARWPIRGLLVDHLGPLGRPVPFALELGKRIEPKPALDWPSAALEVVGKIEAIGRLYADRLAAVSEEEGVAFDQELAFALLPLTKLIDQTTLVVEGARVTGQWEAR